MIDSRATEAPRQTGGIVRTHESMRTYENARSAAVLALEAGRLDEARQHFSAAYDWASEQGTPELADRALCNYAAIAITLGELEDPIRSLREVLMRSHCSENSFLAAYNVSRAYELRKEPKKALFYGRIARDRAGALEEPLRIAAANNQIANSLLADSCFAEAAGIYREALGLLPGGDADTRSLICNVNLAYCEIVMGERRSGLRRLYGVLRTARRNGSRRLEMIARIDLCFAHLELDRYRSAERYGRRGLELAEEIGEVDWIKNGLYLLGEVAVLDGRDGDARERFGSLQQRFYPGQHKLPDLLIGVDVRRMVNLRA